MSLRGAPKGFSLSDSGSYGLGGESNAPGSPGPAGGDWVEKQAKSFMRWCNSVLSRQSPDAVLITDLKGEMGDGVTFPNLLVTLVQMEASDTKTREHQAHALQKFQKQLKNVPTMALHKRQNIVLCLDYLKGRGINLVNIDSGDLMEGNLKLILGLLWVLIQHFQLKGQGASGKAQIMDWCSQILGPSLSKNYATAWRSGVFFCELVNAIRPGLIDVSALDPENAEYNLSLAFTVAQKEFDIPQLLDVEDLTTGRPDEQSLLTYLSYFKNKKESDVKEAKEAEASSPVVEHVDNAAERERKEAEDKEQQEAEEKAQQEASEKAQREAEEKQRLEEELKRQEEESKRELEDERRKSVALEAEKVRQAFALEEARQALEAEKQKQDAERDAAELLARENEEALRKSVEDMDALRRRIRELEDALAEMSSENERQKANLDGTQRKVEELEAEKRRLEAELDEARRQQEVLEADQKRQQEEYASSQRKATEAKEQMEQDHAELLGKRDETISSLESQLKALREADSQKQVELEAETQKQHGDLEALKQQLAELQADHEQTQEKLVSLEGDSQKYQADHKAAQELADQRLAAEQAAVEREQQKAIELQEANSNHELERSEMKKQIADLEEEKKRLAEADSNNLKQQEAERAAAQDSLAAIEKREEELAELKNSIKELETSKDERIKTLEGETHQLQAAKEDAENNFAAQLAGVQEKHLQETADSAHKHEEQVTELQKRIKDLEDAGEKQEGQESEKLREKQLELDNALAENTEIEAELKRHKDELAESQQFRVKLEADLEAANLLAEEKQRQLDAAKQILSEKEREAEQARQNEEALKKSGEEVEQLKQQVAELLEDKKKLEEANASDKQRLQAVEREAADQAVSMQKHHLREIEENAEKHTEEVSTLKKRISDLEQAGELLQGQEADNLREKQKELEDSLSKQAELDAEVKQQKIELDESKHKLEEITVAHAQQQADLDAAKLLAQERLAAVEASNEQHAKEADSHKQERAALEERIEKLEADKGKLEAAQAEHEQQQAARESRERSAGERHQEQEEHMADLRKRLAEAQQGVKQGEEALAKEQGAKQEVEKQLEEANQARKDAEKARQEAEEKNKENEVKTEAGEKERKEKEEAYEREVKELKEQISAAGNDGEANAKLIADIRAQIDDRDYSIAALTRELNSEQAKVSEVTGDKNRLTDLLAEEQERARSAEERAIKANDEKHALDEQIAELKRLLESEKGNADKIVEKFENVQQKVAKLEQELSQEQKDKLELEVQARENRKQHDALKEDLEFVKNSFEDHKKDAQALAADLQKRLNDALAEVQKANSERAKAMESACADHAAIILKLEGDLTGVNAEKNGLLSENKILSEKVGKLDDALKRVDTLQARVELERVAYQELDTNTKAIIDDLNNKIAEFTRNLKETQSSTALESQAALSKLQVADAENSRLNELVIRYELQIKILHQSALAAEEENKELRAGKSKEDTLKDRLRRLEDENADLRRKLQEALRKAEEVNSQPDGIHEAIREVRTAVPVILRRQRELADGSDDLPRGSSDESIRPTLYARRARRDNNLGLLKYALLLPVLSALFLFYTYTPLRDELIV